MWISTRVLADTVFAERCLTRVHPAVKILALVSASLCVSQFGILRPTIVGIAVLGICLFWVASRPRVILLLLVPFTVLVLFVSLLKVWLGGEAPPEAMRYGAGLIWSTLLGLLLLVSTGFIELAVGIDTLLSPLRHLGVRTRRISFGLLIAVRLFILALGAVPEVSKAFAARGIKSHGLSGMRRLGMAILLRMIKSADDMALTIWLRGIDLDSRHPFVIRQYSIAESTVFLISTTSLTALTCLPI